MDADIVVVGAGAAGLSLAWRLADVVGLRVAVVEPPAGHAARSPSRTWCFWEAGSGPFESLVSARWGHVAVVDERGGRIRADLSPMAYKLIRSEDLEAAVGARLDAAPGVRRVTATVTDVEDAPGNAGGGGGGVVVRGTGADGGPVELRARWAFDSRPPGEPRGGRTRLLQHFLGWRVRTAADAFDPSTATLMDFRTAQPPSAVSFGYVLPTSPREALVEYTEFSRRPLTEAAYAAAVRGYLHGALGVGRYQVLGRERGVIPMTDARFPVRAGRAVFRIGTAGGATRPATGYTFAAVQRQADAMARALADGRVPVPPPAHGSRHLWMDSVMLAALDAGRVRGADLFPRLFRGNPPARVMRFLGGTSSAAEDLAIMRSAPLGPMAATVLARAGRPGRRRPPFGDSLRETRP